MKQSRSLFRRFLKVHFLFIFLPPLVLIFITAFFGVSGIDRKEMNPLNLFYIYVLLLGLIMVAFVILSWRFFLNLQRRLARLQEVMSISAEHNAFPEPIPVESDRMDEIDQLGSSFNWMIQQLEYSRRQAHEEEVLRHRLIANLSHDLRTPLTILRGHITRLNKESLSLEGQFSLTEMNHTITRVGDLMNDLLSYTLLTSGKHPFHPASTDIGRLVRASVAAWYPVFEDKEMELDVDIPTEETFYWEVDPKWMIRILDNLFQNMIRHAAEGKYANIVVDIGKEQIIIADKGPGLDNSSYGEGAGIGLSTCNYMLKKMKLHASFTSSEKGTRIVIGRA